MDRGALRQHTVVPWRSPGDSDTLRGSRRAVTTEVDAVTAVAASVLQVPDLGPDDDLWHAGCDSLCALEILHLVNSAYGAHLDANVFVEATTPRAIADRLEQREDHPPVVAYNLDGSRPPLHLIAGAGAPALQYRSLIWALGADQPVVVHEQAGLHQRMPRDRSIRAHARRCADDVIAHQSEGPYTVAGHSYGGGVAIEVVALLTAAGQATRLILLDTLRPPSPLPPRQEPARALWQRLRFHLRAPLLPRVREFAARLRRLWHGRRVGSHHRYELFVHHANVLARHHRPSPVDAPTLVLVTEESRHLVAGDPPHRTVVQVPGGHTSLVYPPHVGEVAACLTAWMSAMR